ncbi:hypothetical protein [Paenibacillus lutrae]|uniref:F0F1-type ATP synthase n=1 Tax=Paenibacillus lutrae TaxID=2078573 RepID=A0A7X3JYU5_9BACL|nr:hypothetical protein [Paenibacillus lutrae]MVO99285.1 hypothetical protein [Paenibacillus lutrae]
MKTAKLGILFVLIYLPFSFVGKMDMRAQADAFYLETRYNAAVNAAVEDGANSLLANEKQEEEARYESFKKVTLNREEALNTFYRTLFMNFGVNDDKIGQNILDQYVAALMIIGYDGCYVYGYESYTGADGRPMSRRLESAKIPYAYTDSSGEVISFTLDDYVIINKPGSREWYEGFRSEMSLVAQAEILKPGFPFDEVRRSTILATIQKELKMTLNEHNARSLKSGAAYTFTLPSIPEEEWNNTIDDIGMLAFIQGIPMGYRAYNNYALGGARVVKKSGYYGFYDNGIPYYKSNFCPKPKEIVEVFSDKKEASSKGFHPKECINGRI